MVFQPALTDDVLCLHRGGNKRVERIRDGRRETFDIARDTLTMLKRGQEVQWTTEGPIDYVHLTITADLVDRVTGDEAALSRLALDRNEQVGFADPLLATLMQEMLRLSVEGEEGRLYYESLLAALVLGLVRRSSPTTRNRATGAAGAGMKGGLAGWRLRAVLDYLTTHRTTDIAFDELVRVSGLSRAHFFRAFQQSTGSTPGRYLERLRVDDARLAIDRGEPLSVTAQSTGFPSQAAMTRAFRRTLNITPETYRRCSR